jgi:hypothetical protein
MHRSDPSLVFDLCRNDSDWFATLCSNAVVVFADVHVYAANPWSWHRASRYVTNAEVA